MVAEDSKVGASARGPRHLPCFQMKIVADAQRCAALWATIGQICRACVSAVPRLATELRELLNRHIRANRYGRA